MLDRKLFLLLAILISLKIEDIQKLPIMDIITMLYAYANIVFQ